jgi:hypothetical protein
MDKASAYYTNSSTSQYNTLDILSNIADHKLNSGIKCIIKLNSIPWEHHQVIHKQLL